MTPLSWRAALAAITIPVALTAGAPGHHPGPSALRRDAAAIHALGVTGVQARVDAGTGSAVATSGVADLVSGRPVPPNGYFRIASAGKTFVATVVLQLAGEGRLSLDDTVDHWLPGLVRGNGNDGRRITIRQLLQHTSGIHDDFPDYTTTAEYYQHRYDVYTPEQLIARAMRHAPDFAPGTSWNYTTTGYLLADLIIEKVTGRPWWDEVNARIVAPLGLRHTFWPGNAPGIPQPRANAYQPFETPDLVDVTDRVIADPEGAIISTTADLNRLLRALFGDRLLRPAQLAEMRHTVPVSADLEALLPGARYGLGIIQRPLPCGGTYWSHPGGDGGYITDDGVTGDGHRAVTVSMSSVLGTADGVLRQQEAADTLVGHALCG
jgi:D-alanyl-D-alanine carboxypeptidase